MNYKKVFVLILFCMLWMPLTYVFNIKDTTVINGSETITDMPSLQKKSFQKKEYQPLFEAWWNSHFGFRKFMLKTKNQIYDWANFGKFHSGYNNNIIQGKQNYLFEKGYFMSFANKCLEVPSQVDNLKKLNDLLKTEKIELFVILAPNKVVTYPEYIPSIYKFLGKDCNYYGVIEKHLSDMGIKVFNSQSLITNIHSNEQYQPFSTTGTHWNFYGAGRTFQEVAKYFGWGDIKIKEILESDTPYLTEKDIAQLLNLWVPYNPKQKFYKPVFEKTNALNGKTVIIGNSFSNELATVSLETNLFSKGLVHFENQPLVYQNIKDIQNAKRVILVYTDIAFMNSNDQLYQKIDFLLHNIRHVAKYTLSDTQTTPGLQISGMSQVENWGRWTSGDTAEFKFSYLPYKNMLFKFNARAFLNKNRDFQNASVYVNGRLFAKWQYRLEQPQPNTTLDISAKDVINGKLTITLHMDNPVSPQETGVNSDNRKIAIGIEDITIETK